MIFAGLAPLDAQTAYFSGATTTLLNTGLNAPYGVAIDSAGNVFIADTANNQVEEVLAVGGYTTVNVLATGFFNPRGVAVDKIGNVFVAVTSNNAIKEILAATGNVITVATGLSNPYGIAVDGAENIFVADFGSSTVKELLAPGYTIALTLGSGFNIPTGVALDASGDVFVADYGNAAVKEILASGGYTTVRTLVTGYGGPSGVAVDAAGNVFFADTYPRHIDELVASDGYSESTLRVLGSGLNDPTAVAVDGQGNLFVADQGNNAIKEIMTQGVSLGSADIAAATPLTAALSFTFLTGGTISAPAVLTQGNTAQDYVDAGTGDTCVARAYSALDTCTVNVAFSPGVSGTRNGAVTLNDSTGSAIATAYLSGNGLGPQLTFSPAESSAVGGALAAPAGVAVDGSGNLFLADTGNDAVKKILANGGYSAVFQLGSGFSRPGSVAIDGAGNVFVADSGNNAVKEILAAGGYAAVATIGSGFNAPQGVTVDSFGNVFVADSGNNAVKESLASGGYTTTNTVGSGFNHPTGVAVDAGGNVFVADAGNNAVKEIVASGGYTTVNAIGSGFAAPGGVTVDGAGNVFVADSGNDAVKEILAAGGYATVNVLSGTFSNPLGVAVDGSGNVFVADSGNNKVVKLDFADPPALTFASTPVGTTSADSPQIVTLNNIGNLPLTFPPPGSGLNPALSSGFTLSGTSTCPQVSSTSSVATLPAASSCTDSISFTPSAEGAMTGSLTVQDDNLDAPPPGYAGQTIALNGTASVTAPNIVFSVPNHVYGDLPFMVSASSNSTGTFLYSVVSGPASIAGTTVTLTGAGTVVLRASEAADANYTAGSRDATFTSAPATPAILFSVPDHASSDAPFAVNATSNSTGAFTYNVVSGPASVAGATVTLSGSGTVVLRASEAADANYAAGSRDASFTVSGVAPAITFTVPNHQYGDAPFVISATSNSTGAFTYNVVSGPATIAGATVTLTGSGPVVLQAVQAAGGSYSAGSTQTTFTVAGSIMLSTKPDIATALPGSPAIFALTITPGGATTFANAVTFAAYGLPDGFSYAFSPASLAAGSAATPVTLTVQTSTAAANSEKPFSAAPLAPIAFAFLVLPLFGLKAGRTLLRKMSSRPVALFVLVLSVGAIFGLTGCGSGVFDMPHKYNIAVIASDAVTGATATTQVSLVVQ